MHSSVSPVQHCGHLPPSDLWLARMLQLADALECMHRYSLLHRDIKAENIVFADTAVAAAAKKLPPVVKFIDLGMATLYEESKPQTGARRHACSQI